MSPLRILLLLAAAYVAFAAALWLFADRLIFQPRPAGYAEAPGLLRIPTEDGGTIAALWLPSPSAQYTVLFSHGNAEDIGDDRPFLEAIRRAGFSVLAYDYRGYGLSPGRPSERRAYRDADAAYAHLTGELGVAPKRVILHGRSLGGAVAVDLASRRPVAGLVLESTFTTAFRTVSSLPIVPFDRFRSADKLARVRAPVLVIHGDRDEVVALEHGRRLYALAEGPKRAYWVRGAGHNDLAAVAGERYWQELRRFAATLPASVQDR